MKNSKLIGMLSKMDKKEWASFKSYVHSDFFNGNQKSLVLWALLDKAYPDFPEKKIERAYLQEKIYGVVNGLSSNGLSVLANHLSKLVFDFWAYQTFQDDVLYRQLSDLGALRDKGLPQQFVWRYHEAVGYLQQRPTDLATYGHRYELLTLAQEFGAMYHDDSLLVELQEVANVFYAHSLLQRLSIACIILNKRRLKVIHYDMAQIEQLIAEVERHDWSDFPLVALYYRALLLLYGQTETDYLQFKALLIPATIAVYELKNLYSYAIGYCTLQTVKGNLSYYQEAFDLYKVQHERQLLFDGQYLQLNHARNMVTLGLRIQEWEWIQTFIEYCRIHIHPNYSDTIYRLNMAAFCFYQKNTAAYQKCIDYLFQISKDVEPLYNIERKSLLLKAYYELKEVRLFESHIATFKSYIKTQRELPDAKKKAYQHFIRLSAHLFNEMLKTPKSRDTQKLEKIAQELKTLPITDKQWLMEKHAACLR
jgi:hypothetical protein